MNMDKYYFIKRLNEKIILTYKPKSIHKVLYVFSTIFWVPLPLILLGVILSLVKVTSWDILYIFGGLSIFSYLIAFQAGCIFAWDAAFLHPRYFIRRRNRTATEGIGAGATLMRRRTRPMWRQS
jgi:hypothetical protein